MEPATPRASPRRKVLRWTPAGTFMSPTPGTTPSAKSPPAVMSPRWPERPEFRGPPTEPAAQRASLHREALRWMPAGTFMSPTAGTTPSAKSPPAAMSPRWLARREFRGPPTEPAAQHASPRRKASRWTPAGTFMSPIAGTIPSAKSPPPGTFPRWRVRQALRGPPTERPPRPGFQAQAVSPWTRTTISMSRIPETARSER